MTELQKAAELALELLEGIVNSNWRNWEELASPEQFELWAKRRANHCGVVLRQALDHVPDTTKMIEPSIGLISSEWAGLEESPNSTTDVAEREACIVGIKGSAYAPTDTKRAYTYANQPGNVVAYKLGRASYSASLQRAGDFIDSGLILLKELQVEGYGVFDIGAEYTAPPKREWVGLTLAEFKQATDGLEDLEDCCMATEDKLGAKNR